MPSSAGRLALRPFCAFAILAAAAGVAGAAEKAGSPNDAAINLDQSVQALKDEVVQFNRDAEVAQDEFLYPPQTRVIVYVSSKVTNLYLKNVQVTLDDGQPVSLVYDDDASRAMLNPTNSNTGPMQTVLRANVQRGAHRLRVRFDGVFGDGKDAANIAAGSYEALFDKGVDASELELQIIPGARRNAPTMQLKEWRAEQ